MKKLALFLALSLCAIALWAVPASQSKTVSGFGRYDTSGKYTTKTFFFDGFDFETLGSYVTMNGLETSVTENYKDIASATPGKYTLIGYSMGGLTALGYAGYYNQKNKSVYNNIEAVITISGADRGASILRGGLGSTARRAKAMSDIVYKGVAATVPVITLGEIPGIPLPTSPVTASDFILKAFFPKKHRILTEAALNNVPLTSYAQIRDLIPDSDFTRDNVAETKPHTYKKQTGTKTVLHLSAWSALTIPLAGLPFITYTQEPVYTYYTTYEYKTKLGNNLPVGYIVGLKHDMRDMLGDKGKQDKWINATRTCANVAAGFHLANNFSLLGLLTGSPAKYSAAKTFADWLDNIDGNLKDFLGGKEGDSFLTKEDQYYPPQFTDPNTNAVRYNGQKYLGNPKNGIYDLTKYNHKSINPKDTKDNRMADKEKNKGMEELYITLDYLVGLAKQ